MASISRTRSRSVSTAPFTRATGLSVTSNELGDEAAGWASCAACVAASLGAWEAICAPAARAVINKKIENLYFIIPHPPFGKRSEKRGREYLSPWFLNVFTGIAS